MPHHSCLRPVPPSSAPPACGTRADAASQITMLHTQIKLCSHDPECLVCSYADGQQQHCRNGGPQATDYSALQAHSKGQALITCLLEQHCTLAHPEGSQVEGKYQRAGSRTRSEMSSSVADGSDAPSGAHLILSLAAHLWHGQQVPGVPTCAAVVGPLGSIKHTADQHETLSICDTELMDFQLCHQKLST